MWEMMNLLEQSLRVPLLIRPAPGDSRFVGRGAVYSHPVELLDLFRKMVMLSRFICSLPVSLTLKATQLQRLWRVSLACRLHPPRGSSRAPT